MKIFFVVVWLILSASYCFSQNIYQIKADSVRIYNSCDTAELILENRTQNVAGFLFNKGKGRTEFRKLRMKVINGETLILDGQDTVSLTPVVKTVADPLYIRRQFAVAQVSSNFWIDGVGKASAFMTNNSINSPHTVYLKPEGSTSRWASFLYNPETGAGNQGSDFRFARYNDTGAFVSNVITIERATGIVTLNEGIRTNGRLGVNTPVPGFRVSVSDTVTAVYNPANKKENYPAGTMLGLYNMAPADTNYSGISFQALNSSGLYQSAYMGIVSVGGNTYQSNIVIGQRTGPIAYTERMRIASNGNVGIGTVAPAALLDVNGALRIGNAKNNVGEDSILSTDANGIVKLKARGTGIMPVGTFTGNIALGQNDYTAIINNTAAAVVTLPAAVNNKGRIYNIKKVSNNTMTVTIQPQTGELLDGSSSFVLSTYNKCIQIQSTGSTWYIIN